MAKRKYVKENNLVKAINTDSLELQKPLVNEYYDINVHNSNMDKIDLGYKQNKNDISNINYELSKTENTKYTTENGVKEFSCKDGYVDNVVIEGETLVNLCYYPNLRNENSDRYFQRFDNRISGSDTYTIIIPKGKDVGFEVYNANEVGTDYAFGVSGDVGFKVVQIPTDHRIATIHCLKADCSEEELKTICETSIILKGDHTDKPISYFEGLKSVGQGDKIEILTQNSDETKQDKKQILTTLRSLPNGVKDTIEKRGNKYVKVQRCGEIVLNGSEDWFKVGDTVQANTVQFGFKKGNDVAYKGDSEVFFNCDKIPPTEERNWQEDREFIFINPNDYIISISKTRLSTQDVAGFKTWLKSNPITVVYELATPIIEELPNFNPQTFSDKTTFLLNSGVVQGECDFEVTNSLGSELEVLKNKVSDLDDNYVSKYTLTPLNGWGMDNVEFIRDGRHIQINAILNTQGTLSKGTKIATFPYNLRPNITVISDLIDISGNAIGGIEIVNNFIQVNGTFDLKPTPYGCKMSFSYYI